jgi:uncharacterized protein (TIGR03435 family)
MTKATLAGASLAILLPGLLAAQPQTDPPSFEVADVHLSAPGAKPGDAVDPAGGRVELRASTMLDLVSYAYRVDQANVIGGPPWLTSDRFDIVAKAPSGTPEDKLPELVQALLGARFHLVTHADKKDLPAFILTAKKNVKLPPAAAPDSPPGISRGEGDAALNVHWKLASYTMPALAELLPQIAPGFVNHPVVDETHLAGAFDFPLDWMGMNIYRRAKANPDGPPAVGLFDAVDKLGLHLEAGMRPAPVIVIDSVDRTPTPNPEGVTAKLPSFPTEFDVAELRPAKPLSLPAGQTLGPLGQANLQNGRLELMSATLKGLLTLALDMDARMLVGGPKWIDEDRFDVIAKTERTVPIDAMRVMLKNLLTERLHLVTHNEAQPLPVFVLGAGKKPKLKESDGSARSDCNIVNTDRRYYVCQNTTMAQFADRLPSVSAAYIHPPLLDLTGLTGAYDFQLYWTPRALLQNNAKIADAAPTPIDELTVFEAVDKQLGLKIEEQKHPIPVVVIDKVDRTPTQN